MPDPCTQKIENVWQAELSTKCAARDHFSFLDRNCDFIILMFFRIKFGLFRLEIFLKMVPSLSINAQFKGKPWEFFLPTKDQASWGCQSLSPEIRHVIYTEIFAQNLGTAKKCGNNMEPTFLSSF